MFLMGISINMQSSYLFLNFGDMFGALVFVGAVCLPNLTDNSGLPSFVVTMDEDAFTRTYHHLAPKPLDMPPIGDFEVLEPFKFLELIKLERQVSLFPDKKTFVEGMIRLIDGLGEKRKSEEGKQYIKKLLGFDDLSAISKTSAHVQDHMSVTDSRSSKSEESDTDSDAETIQVTDKNQEVTNDVKQRASPRLAGQGQVSYAPPLQPKLPAIAVKVRRVKPKALKKPKVAKSSHGAVNGSQPPPKFQRKPRVTAVKPALQTLNVQTPLNIPQPNQSNHQSQQLEQQTLQSAIRNHDRQLPNTGSELGFRDSYRNHQMRGFDLAERIAGSYLNYYSCATS
jgi:hypothetical protein